MDPETIKRRRKAIQRDARCVGCGSTLAFCKGQRGQDPTAPPWFGCCARGTDMRPCHHQVDTRALVDLLKEIESGTVRDEADMLLDQVQEHPRRSRLLRDCVTALANESWPEDVPMGRHF